MPSGTFDILSDSFNKAQLVLTILGLSVGIAAVKVSDLQALARKSGRAVPDWGRVGRERKEKTRADLAFVMRQPIVERKKSRAKWY